MYIKDYGRVGAKASRFSTALKIDGSPFECYLMEQLKAFLNMRTTYNQDRAFLPQDYLALNFYSVSSSCAGEGKADAFVVPSTTVFLFTGLRALTNCWGVMSTGPVMSSGTL